MDVKEALEKWQASPSPFKGWFTSDVVGLHWAAIPALSLSMDMAKCLVPYVPGSHHCMQYFTSAQCKTTHRTYSMYILFFFYAIYSLTSCCKHKLQRAKVTKCI
ncbi:hypothetical protein AB205_0076320 [Aquarana catesbeiana]|uniref:Uncharacterized protein n=1 Tax=Aquarana catesbeiana TaxID=8400 RepID=A0A2G9PNF7_AQUCT|nr:hypothetical protein AB205_0076320 [Aquarana catesbeiana]